jgi:hypothetical protein
MKTFQRMIAGLVVSVGLGMSTPAMAEPILLDSSSIGTANTITFDGFVDGGPSLSGLSSQLTLTLSSIVNGVYNFDYALTNTGATGDSISSRVSGFAFNTDPSIVGASSTGTYNFTQLGGNYPNGIGSVDVCFKGASTGSCAGGGSAGVFDGQTGSGTLSLDFGGAIGSLSLSDFFVRYQSIDGIPGVTSASGRQTGSTTSSSSGGSEVPAPGMVLIFAMALVALFRSTWRKGAAFLPQGRTGNLAYA